MSKQNPVFILEKRIRIAAKQLGLKVDEDSIRVAKKFCQKKFKYAKPAVRV